MNFKNNKVVLAILSIIIIFIICVVSWFMLVNLKYSDYTKNIPKTELGLYYLEDNENTYYMKKPDMFIFTGNLVVGYNYEENGEEHIVPEVELIIWPKMFSDDYEYKIFINETNGDKYNIRVDKYMMPYDSKYTEIIQSHNEEITKLCDRASSFFWNKYI